MSTDQIFKYKNSSRENLKKVLKFQQRSFGQKLVETLFIVLSQTNTDVTKLNFLLKYAVFCDRYGLNEIK